MGDTADDILGDPGWFPEELDTQTGEFCFVATDRATLATEPFLDRRWDRSQMQRRRVPAAAALAKYAASQNPVAVNFIWHTAFCCSTLIARLLDEPGRNLSLCEPRILITLADAKRAGAFASGHIPPSVPRTILNLLSRPFARGDATTLKPAPAANALLPETIRLTGGKMLFLYSDCRSFLISVAKKSEEGRLYARRMFHPFLSPGHPLAQWPAQKLLALTDLEVAALVWHMQLAEFGSAWKLLAPARRASLDCAAFLAAPLETLVRLDDFFGLGLGEKHLAAVAAGPLMHSHSKQRGRSYDAEQRRGEHDAVEKQLAADLDSIVSWSYEIFPETPRPEPLPGALMPVTAP